MYISVISIIYIPKEFKAELTYIYIYIYACM